MSINFESHKLDRRSFLKGAGMVGAAGLLAVKYFISRGIA